MTEAIRRAKSLPGDPAGLVAEFLRSQLNEDGGFAGRDGRSDLYYTMFAAEALTSLDEDVPFQKIKRYLDGFADIHSLDLIHMGCLMRNYANLESLCKNTKQKAIERVKDFRSSDGGFSSIESAGHGSAYGIFIALGIYQDLGIEVENTEKMIESLQQLRQPDGSYANERSVMIGSVPATAAAVTTLHELGEPIPSDTMGWLMSQCRDGGFRPFAGAPEPGLLSTATAIHALSISAVPLDSLRDDCLRYIASLKNNDGFRGSSADNTSDCEYTYYALLAMGHLAKP